MVLEIRTPRYPNYNQMCLYEDIEKQIKILNEQGIKGPFILLIRGLYDRYLDDDYYIGDEIPTETVREKIEKLGITTYAAETIQANIAILYKIVLMDIE
jgi:hypothetical protein